MAAIELVLWDWNGTLLDDVQLCRQVLNQMLAETGCPNQFDTRGYRRIFGFPVQEYYRRAGFDFSRHSFEVLAQDIRKAGEGRYDAVNSRPGMVEIQSAACSKGKSARRLAKLLGRRILVCVGDSQNDLSMLREADLPFLTGDGDPALAALGIPQVCPCGEGAVAGVIEMLALREKEAHI